MGEIGPTRKVRSDKKRDVSPTIKWELKEAISRLSFITNTKMKDSCSEMISFATNDIEIIQRLSVSFVRDVRFNDTMFRGHLDNIRFPRTDTGKCVRMHMRLVTHDFENLKTLAYALDLTPTRVSAILLDICIHDFRFLNMYVQKYLSSELTRPQMLEFREMLKYINKNSNNEMTMAALLSAIVDEVKRPIAPEPKPMGELIVNHWRQPKQ